MMRHLLSILFTVCCLGLSAQTFFDDFESYAPGDYPSATNASWTTWSGTEGGGEDVRVTDAMAASGTNSIYFEGQGSGGPQDVILDFGGAKNTGTFVFESKFYIPAGKGAYFNFQGTSSPGQIWSMNTFMRPNGSFEVDDSQALWVSSSFPHDEWFTVRIEANLTHNFWRALINGNCVGSFENTGTNAVASLDLFPIDANYDFYVDDIGFDYSEDAEEPAPIEDDVFLVLNSNETFGFSGTQKSISGTFINNGMNMINSVELDYSIGADNYNQVLDNLELPPGESLNFQLQNGVTLSNDPIAVNVRVARLNGVEGDDDACNNVGSLSYSGFTPHPDRKVFAEEATGTWCPWCPRGDVFMNLMDERYPDHFVGIAVHNGDPMVVPTWDSGLPTFPGFAGYPSVIFDRTAVIDPSQLEPNLAAGLQLPPTAKSEHWATYDESTRELSITVATTFAEQTIGSYSLLVGLTEDGVMGSTAAYAQANAYAGGGNGTMGGYETLPNPVPASMMVYNHTARALFTPFLGMSNAFSPSVIIEAGTYEHTFNYTVPADQRIENMHIVSAIFKSGGIVDNAQSTSIETSVDTKDISLENGITIAPNPANDMANIRIQLEESVQLSIQVVDAMGRVVDSRNYGQMDGDQVYPVVTQGYTPGIYYVRIQANDKFAVKKLIVNR